MMRESRRIVVPIFQRSYAWESGQIDDLWEDLDNQLEESFSDRHLFLGAIVFNYEDDADAPDLVDGQQRITSLCLTLASFWHRLQEVQDNLAGRLQERIEEMLFDRDAGNLEPWEENENGWGFKLHPSEKDQRNFSNMLLRGNPADGRHLIAKAWRATHEKIQERVDEKIPSGIVEGSDEWEKASSSALVQLAENIVKLLDERTSFAVIEVREPHNPFVVFEHLNSRGLELAQSDLIKNYLLRQLPLPQRGASVNKWSEMSATVSEKKLVDYLRHWYVAFHRRIPKGRVYSSFRDLLASPSRIREIQDNLDRYSYWYDALVEGSIREDHPEMQGAPNNNSLDRQLDRFSRMSFKQALPVVLAFLGETDPRTRAGQQQLIELLQVLEVAFVRLFVTRNVRGSVFEAKLNDLCAAARSGGQTAVNSVRSILRRLCEDNEVADELDWSKLTPTIARARFLLYGIAQHQLGEGLTLGDPDQWHVEHILPQARRDEDHDGVRDEDYDNLVSRIGNLTLLLSFDNQGLRNLGYAEKRPIYGLYDGSQTEEDDRAGIRNRPAFPLNQKIAERWDVWDEISIEARGRALAQDAGRVWAI